MKPGLIKTSSGFLLGAALAFGPGFALIRRGTPPASPTLRHDYFPPPHLASDRRFRIVAFGSSSTHGYGASSPEATYPSQLQRILGGASPATFDVVNRGVDGDNIKGMLDRLDDDILPRRPDLIVWQLGSNDALHGTDPDAFATAMRAGIARIQAAGIPLVLVGPQWNPEPARAALFARMNDVMLGASRDNALPMVNRFVLMQRWLHDGRLPIEAMVNADGLHMTDVGYALLARAVYETAVVGVPSLRERLWAASAG